MTQVSETNHITSVLHWCIRWGLPMLAVLSVVPESFTMHWGWLQLHTFLEMGSVVMEVAIFFVVLESNDRHRSATGTYVAGAFLLAAVLDVGHLLMFPGMPNWLPGNQDTYSIDFWLLARTTSALGLMVCVASDWKNKASSRDRIWVLTSWLVLSVLAIPCVIWLAQHRPTLMWQNGSITSIKIQVEGCIIAMLVLGLLWNLGKIDQPSLLNRNNLVAAILNLIVAEFCMVLYQHTNDIFILMGHLYKDLGYYLLYRVLTSALIERPFTGLSKDLASVTRKQLELEAIFNSSPDGIMLLDTEGTICKVNPKFSELLGYHAEEVLGLTPDFLLPLRFRQHHAQHIRNYFSEPTSRAMGSGRELVAQRKDGSEFAVEISLDTTEIQGSQYAVATVRDVQVQRNLQQRLRISENRMRAFLNHSVDWLWETDAIGTVLKSSPSVKDILGLTEQEIEGTNLFSLFLNTDRGGLNAHLSGMLAQHEPLILFNHVNETSQGTLRNLETNAKPYFADDGAFLGYRGVTRDATTQRNMQYELERSERLFRHAFDDFPTGMAFVNAEGLITRFNSALQQILGYDHTELQGARFAALVAQDDRASFLRQIQALFDQSIELYTTDLKMSCKDRQTKWVRLAVAISESDSSANRQILLMASDVTAEKEAAAINDRLLTIIEHIPETVAVCDADGKTLYLNPHGRDMLGIGRDESLQNESLNDHHSQAVALYTRHRMFTYAAEHGVWEGETSWRHRNGEEILTWQVVMAHKDNNGKVNYWTKLARDIRERKRLEEQLEHQATHDALTGLANRTLLRERLSTALAQAIPSSRLLAVMHADLDNFKRINDTLGHAQGDKILVESSKRLQSCLSEHDTLARQSGDEFIVLMTQPQTLSDVVSTAERLVRSLAEPVEADGRQVLVNISLGISLFPFDDPDPEELLRKADVAMYWAKERGRNGYQFYSSDMDARYSEDLQLELDLRKALQLNQLSLVYQPKYLLETGSLAGFEALLRWQHPKRGFVSPSEFIPIAERSALIVELGEWVLRQVCAQLQQWQKDAVTPMPVAVNVSAQQFDYVDIVKLMRTLLKEFQISGHLLELEITEGVLMHDPVATTQTLQQVKALGINIAIDDFGTGYSSLGYLKQFPVDVLKIDRAFINEVATNTDDSAIVRAITSMAHNLHVQVIAEGVETPAQLNMLRETGVDFIQGYYSGKPMDAMLATELCRHDAPHPQLLESPMDHA